MPLDTLENHLNAFVDHLGALFGSAEKVVAPVVNVTNPAPDGVRIDATQSEYDGNPTGGTLGSHAYVITTTRNSLDVLAGATDEPVIAGNDVVFDGTDTFTKQSSGNGWSSWFQSVAPIGNALAEDFAVSWLVESVTGTIREMGGFDNAPDSNNSFTHGEYMMYQVNGNQLQIYESGTRKAIVDYELQVGDRLGIKVEGQHVCYFVIRGSVLVVLYESNIKTNAILYFKGALNRGDGQSGHSTMGDVHSHKVMSPQAVKARINGPADHPLHDDDIAALATVGLVADPTSAYSLILATKQQNAFFPAGTQWDYLHSYYVSTGQASGMFT